jgi:putative PEP-CTERM system TPR-repeat lipoprotein
MRNAPLGWIILGGWLGLWPMAAHADYLSDARAAINKGDLKSAQIDLRNAVRADPQNAEAHFWLGKIVLELGDAVAAEREAKAALDRGYDPHLAVQLYSQSLLAQQKYNDLLKQLQPVGKDPALDAQILVARGFAQLGLRQQDEAQKSFAEAEKTAPTMVEPLLAEARVAAMRGDLVAAQAKIDHALQLQPKSTDARLAKAQMLRGKGDNAGALAVLDQTIADQPESMAARVERAGVLLGMGQTDKANADIDVVLKATPGNIQALYLQAVGLVTKGDFKAADVAIEHLSTHLAQIPRGYFLEAVVKERLGQLEQAEDAAQRYLARAPNDLAAYNLLARIEFTKRRPDLVVTTLKKVEDSGQGNTETYDLLGRAYSATGRGDEAVKAFQKAQSLAPDNTDVQSRLAGALIRAGQPDAAMVDLESLLAKSPKQPEVGEALFFAALATADLGKATDAVAKVRQAQGDTPVVQNLEALLKLVNLDYAGAQAAFAAIAKSAPDFTPAKINLARVMAAQGNAAEGEAVLQGLLDKQPTLEPALTMLVNYYLQTNQFPKATALVERAHAAAPDNAQLTGALGQLYVRAGNPGKAVELVDQDKPGAGNPNLLAVKAGALIAEDKKNEARQVYEQILKTNPDAPGVRRQLVALLVGQSDFEGARSVIKSGLAASPRNYDLLQSFTFVDLKAGGVDTALSTAERLYAQDRDNGQARALKGDVLMTAARTDEAIAAYSEALAADPSPFLLTRLASAQIRGGHADAAAKTLKDWIAKHPDDVVSIGLLAEADIAAKSYDDATTNLRAVLKRQPQNAVALNNLAWVMLQQKDPSAEKLAREAYILQQGPQTADTLGWILASNGKSDTGIVLLRQASSEARNDPQILYHYAVVLNNTGHKDDAIKLLTALVSGEGTFADKDNAKLLLDQLKGPSAG